MKQLLYILFFCLGFAIININAQGGGWYWSNPLPQGNDLKSIQFITPNSGFAIGNYGTLLKTTNGGINWEYLLLQSPINLSSLYFVNSNVGYAVGDSGLILKTTNGGESWINQVSGVDTNLTDISFFNENIGYATGLWGLILKTTDGGSNWTNHSIYYNNKSVCIIDSNNIFVVGDAGTILRTTNAGTNWFSVVLGSTVDLRDVKFTTNLDGFVVGGTYNPGYLYKTTDGGNTWMNIINDNPLALTSIFFKDTNTGFATGINGELLKTTDGGNSWTNIPLDTKSDLNQGYFVDSNNGFIIGSGGTILKTNDGGNSWNKITTGSETFLYSSNFLNNNFGLAVGGEGTILKTTNGGISWSEKNVNLVSNPGILGIHIFDLNNAVAVGSFGFTHLTSDGGETWSSFSGINSSDLVSLTFVNDTVGFAAGYWGTIVMTTNSGINWTLLNSGTSSILFFDIDFIDENNGFVCGSNGTILKTTDGGTNWSSLNSGTTNSLRGMDFIDNNNGLTVGDNASIYKTTNGGQDWNLVTSAQFGSMYFRVKYVNPQFAILISDGGNILFSLDGGNSWEAEDSKTNNSLYGLTIVDSTSFIAVGDKGTIIKSINWSIPVELVSFNASVNSNSALLNWSTVTELNNSGFDIERKQVFNQQSSVGNEEWNTISFISGNGTTTEKHLYSFQDKDLSAGKYQYRLKQIDFDGTYEYSNNIEVEIRNPGKFVLEQNYPNPFNPSTIIKYTIPSITFSDNAIEGSRVQLKVYDVLGNLVATLVNDEKPAGFYEVEFGASNLSSGIYFYKLTAGSFVETKKMILLR